MSLYAKSLGFSVISTDIATRSIWPEIRLAVTNSYDHGRAEGAHEHRLPPE